MRERIAELARRVDRHAGTRAAGGRREAVAVARRCRDRRPSRCCSLGKLKFLLLGLTKASTFVSMFAFFGVYWSIYGWPLALGLVLSIYIHEMGHVAMLRRLGIAAGAPMFIPGVGALVMLKQHVADPLTDAKIGLAGPVWGLGAALAAFGVTAHRRADLARDRAAHRVPQPVQSDSRLAAGRIARVSRALATRGAMGAGGAVVLSRCC